MNYSWPRYNQNASLSEFLVEQQTKSNKQPAKKNQQRANVTSNEQRVKRFRGFRSDKYEV